MLKKCLAIWITFLLLASVGNNVMAQKKLTRESPKYPPIKTGFLIDLDPDGKDGFFYIGLEIANWRIGKQKHTPGYQSFSLDAGVASSRVLMGASWGIFFEGTVGPFLWIGYNISENAPAFGIGFTVFKL